MSAAGNAYPFADSLNSDAYGLIQLGIPPDHAIAIAARARAMQTARLMSGQSPLQALPSETGASNPTGSLADAYASDATSGQVTADAGAHLAQNASAAPPIFPKQNPFEARREKLQGIVATPQWKAFAHLIGQTEKTNYGSINNGVPFNNSFDPSTQPYPGRGAGVFQITGDTFPDLAAHLGIDRSTPFDPDTQNIMAAQKVLTLKGNPMQDILNGDITSALPKINSTWASLPGGPNIGGRYAHQPYASYNDVLNAYYAALNFYANEGQYVFDPQTRQLVRHKATEE